MELINRDALIGLARHHSWPSVTLTIPTHRLPRETAGDRIRLKNLLRQATAKLIEEGMRQPEAASFTQPVQDMNEDDSFWRDTAEGLAIFLSHDEVQSLRLDVALPEQVVVGDRYYLRSLIAAHRGEEPFFVLALDKNVSRLFAGDRMQMEPVDLGDTPVTFEDAMKYDDANRTLTQHSAAGRVASRGRQHEGSVYAGYGGIKDVDVEQTTRYARLIERGVTQALRNQDAPLLLFGNERLVSAYREVNTYQNLTEQQVLGASDYLSPLQLQQQALEVLAPVLEADVERDLRELRENEGSSLASHDPKAIVSAAAAGRVKTLFFDDSFGPFGLLEDETFEVRSVCEGAPRMLRERMTTEEQPDGECGWDLVDLAAAQTVAHGGEIHAFTGENPPVQGVAALYRY